MTISAALPERTDEGLPGRRAQMQARRDLTDGTRMAVLAMVCGSMGLLASVTSLLLFVGGAPPFF